MIRYLLSQRKTTLFYLCFLLCIPAYLVYATHDTPTQQAVTFQTDKGHHTITLEVARTEAQKTKGLMYRKSLPQNTGMVFIYDTPTQAGIWMKNTYIPLDVIFIDCNNKIVECVPREPHTLEASIPIKKICTIIEVNTRFCSKNSIKVNDTVVFTPAIEN